MNKKNKLKKQKFSLKNIPHIKLHDESIFSESSAKKTFQNESEVANILLQCLIENDTETFMEVLDAYLSVNRTKIAKKTKLTRATITQAFSKNGNPTLKTIAKIVHQAVALRN
jgi:probable addiction module antidote protein